MNSGSSPLSVAARRSKAGGSPAPVTWSCYYAGRVITRFILFCTMRIRMLRRAIPDRTGGYILAISHQGHLDPFIASTVQNRPVVWMTRKEFFRFGWARFLIRRLNGFCVDRGGIPVAAIRHAILHAGAGHVVGICPEGGIVHGEAACFRGGAIKRGLCSVSIRAQVPIVPCLILGSARLQAVGPWLPVKRGKLWIAYAPPIFPPAVRSTRESRHALARQVQNAYVQLYEETVATLGVDSTWVS